MRSDTVEYSTVQYTRSTSSKNRKCGSIGEKMIIICHIENDDINQMKSNQVMSIFITQSAKMVLRRCHLYHDDCCQFRNIEIQKYSNHAIRYIGQELVIYTARIWNYLSKGKMIGLLQVIQANTINKNAIIFSMSAINIFCENALQYIH